MEAHIVAWIGFGSAAVGALISFSSTSFSNRQRHRQELTIRNLEREEEHAVLMREKLEELYVLAKHWGNGIGNNYISLSNVMNGKITYNDHLDLVAYSGPFRSLILF